MSSYNTFAGAESVFSLQTACCCCVASSSQRLAVGKTALSKARQDALCSIEAGSGLEITDLKLQDISWFSAANSESNAFRLAVFIAACLALLGVSFGLGFLFVCGPGGICYKVGIVATASGSISIVALLLGLSAFGCSGRALLTAAGSTPDRPKIVAGVSPRDITDAATALLARWGAVKATTAPRLDRTTAAYLASGSADHDGVSDRTLFAVPPSERVYGLHKLDSNGCGCVVKSHHLELANSGALVLTHVDGSTGTGMCGAKETTVTHAQEVLYASRWQGGRTFYGFVLVLILVGAGIGVDVGVRAPGPIVTIVFAFFGLFWWCTAARSSLTLGLHGNHRLSSPMPTNTGASSTGADKALEAVMALKLGRLPYEGNNLKIEGSDALGRVATMSVGPDVTTLSVQTTFTCCCSGFCGDRTEYAVITKDVTMAHIHKDSVQQVTLSSLLGLVLTGVLAGTVAAVVPRWAKAVAGLAIAIPLAFLIIVYWIARMCNRRAVLELSLPMPGGRAASGILPSWARPTLTSLLWIRFDPLAVDTARTFKRIQDLLDQAKGATPAASSFQPPQPVIADTGAYYQPAPRPMAVPVTIPATVPAINAGYTGKEKMQPYAGTVPVLGPSAVPIPYDVYRPDPYGDADPEAGYEQHLLGGAAKGHA